MSTNATSTYLRRIVVVGGGAAGWITAAALAKALGRACAIRVVPVTDDAPADFFGADTLLPLRNARLSLLHDDEDRLLAAAGGAFGWGVAFDGWAAPGRAWFLPFGSIGANLGPVPFHQLVLRLRRAGRSLRLADYSLCALAAQAGRFARPTDDPRSVLATGRYALHVDAAGFATFLRNRAEAAGARCIAAPFVRFERTADGCIGAVYTADGARHPAELYLDCSANGVLRAGDDVWEDWTAWLACDRALTTRMERQAATAPYCVAEAHTSGWTRHLPLAHGTGLVSFYAETAGAENVALASLRRAAGRAAVGEIFSVALRFGRLTAPWRGNCVALGTAAALVAPLVAGNLHFLQSSLARLLELLPGRPQADAMQREYNRRTAAELDNVRDQLIALCKTNGRHGEPFWDDRRAMAIPESLDYRMRVYASRGKIVQYDEEPFEEASWISLFDEQGIGTPRNHPMANGFAISDIEAHLARIRSIMLHELKNMPPHVEYLARLGHLGADRRDPSREALP